MKLIRFGQPGNERPGVIDGAGAALDVGEHFVDYDREFFQTGGLERLVELIDTEALPRIELDGVRLGPPVARPGNVLCIGLNFHDHARETNQPVPQEPIVFNKAPNTVVGPEDDLLVPPASRATDWEVELAVVIGRTARYLPDEQSAEACIAGYSISNDVSERDWQLHRGGQWVKGKSAETFNPLGPWLVTKDEVADVQNLDMRLWLNGELIQNGSTAEMVFGVSHLIWYLSQFMVLDPGDLINTGTPANVGMALDPPRYLDEGDVVELEIESLGRQRQRVRRATA